MGKGVSHGPQRDRILRAAAQLFAQRGYHAVGISAIQDAVNLGRGALYHHIHSKEDLLYEITREYITDLAAFAEQLDADMDPRDRIKALGRHLVLKIASHQAELTVCFRDVHSLTDGRRAEVVALHSKYEKAWREVLVDGADLGVFRPYDPVVLKGVLGMYFYSYLWIRPEGTVSPVTIAERLNEMALRMVQP